MKWRDVKPGDLVVIDQLGWRMVETVAVGATTTKVTLVGEVLPWSIENTDTVEIIGGKDADTPVES